MAEACYNVFTGEKKEEIRIIQGEGKWISLGHFYFSRGKASVVLDDRISIFGQVIIPDAMKWVKE